MSRLVCNIANPRHFYKRDGHLVRTPISKVLNIIPDEAANFDCAYGFRQDFPTTGFDSAQVHYTEVPLVGKAMRKSYLGTITRNGPYIWRQNKTFPTLDPGFIWYQGAYSTSHLGWGFPEAYMTIPAYHFTIPSEYSDFDVIGAYLTLTHGGTILKHGSAKSWQSQPDAYPVFASQAADWLLGSGTGWRDPWVMKLGCFSALNMEPRYMYA